MGRRPNIGWNGDEFEERLRGAVDGIGSRMRGGRIVWIVVLAVLVLYIMARSIVSVGAGERAAIFSKFSGVLETQLGEGWHLLVPWVWEATKYDVKRHTWTITIGEQVPQLGYAEPEPELIALTKDGQEVSLDVTAVYHPDPDKVWLLHRDIGPHYKEKVIRPKTRCISRMVVSQYAVTDVYSRSREEIQDTIESDLREGLGQCGIILDQLLLRNVKFSPQFQQTVEAKQVAIQEYEQMQYLLESAEKTQEKTIIEAEGEAESLRLQGQALRANPLALEYEYARKVAPAVQAIVTEKATTPPGLTMPGGR